MSSATDPEATVYKHLRRENNLLSLKRKRRLQLASHITDAFGDTIAVCSIITKLTCSIYFFSGRSPAIVDSMETVSYSALRNDYLPLQ